MQAGWRLAAPGRLVWSIVGSGCMWLGLGRFARCSTITMVEIVGWELVGGVVALFGGGCRDVGVGVRGVFG